MESMELKVAYRYAKIAPRKARLVVDLIRGVTRGRRAQHAAPDAQARLADGQQAAQVGRRHRGRAVSTRSRRNSSFPSAWVDAGPMRKGWWARPRGMAARLRYRTSHIHLVVSTPRRGVKEGEGSRP